MTRCKAEPLPLVAKNGIKASSPIVAEGIWADADDFLMLDALSSLDACCMEDVDWDNLIEHRAGDLCRKRWNQMVQFF